MRKAHYTVSGKDVQEHAARLIRQYLGLPDYSKKCRVSILLQVLFAAAARLTSIFAACMHLKDAPSCETIRKALLATLPDFAKLQRGVNRALAGDLPKALRKRKQRLAIDLHLVPYYGEPHKDPKEIYRSQAKDGTNNFHAYASAYVVCKGQRYTVALTPVERGAKMKDVVQRLLAQARRTSIRPCLLLLDRGFYSVDVIRYLKAARVPFLMPAVRAAACPRTANRPQGSARFRCGNVVAGVNTRWPRPRKKATVSICVFCGNYRGAWKKQGRYAWVYAYWGIKPELAALGSRHLSTALRHRDELSPTERGPHQDLHAQSSGAFLLHRLALILRNVWVWLHWEILSSLCRGRRQMRLERLRFKAMLLWLLHVAESILGIADETLTERPTKTRVTANQRPRRKL